MLIFDGAAVAALTRGVRLPAAKGIEAGEGIAHEAPATAIDVAVSPIQLHAALIAVTRLRVELGLGFVEQGFALTRGIGVTVAEAAKIDGRQIGRDGTGHQLSPMAGADVPWILGLAR